MVTVQQLSAHHLVEMGAAEDSLSAIESLWAERCRATVLT
jgi:hypothetical protein